MAPYCVGEIIWAKIKGYPNWPATVQDPVDGSEVKMNKKKNMYFVRFFSADDKQQVSWVPEDELFEFPERLEEMKTASEHKGGKTYTDLRKCIDLAALAHKQYLEEIEKNPHMREEIGVMRQPGADIVEASASKPPPKSRVKAAAPVAAKKEKTPAAKSTTKRTAISPSSSSSAAPVSQQRQESPQGTGAVVVPRLKIKNLPPKQVEAAASPAANSKQRNGKKRDVEQTEELNNGQPQAKKATSTYTESLMASGKKAEAASAGAKDKSAAANSEAVAPSVVKLAREITVGFIGLEDPRINRVAKILTERGVTVKGWSKDEDLSIDLEYHGGTRIKEVEKIFEEVDVVFLTASSSYELQALLSGADHLARKVKPPAKNKIKGVCVFTSMSKKDSEEIARKLEPKNILYLECAWIGSVEHAAAKQLSVVCSRSRAFFQHCHPLFEIICQKSLFIGEEFGQALVVKAAVAMSESIALAGMVEAAHFAQQNGLDYSSISPALTSLGYGNSAIVDSRIKALLSFPTDSKDQTNTFFKEQYKNLRDAMHLAHPMAAGENSSVTHLTSVALDLYKTHFATYSLDRESDQEPERGVMAAEDTNDPADEKPRGTPLDLPSDEEEEEEEEEKESSPVQKTTKHHNSTAAIKHKAKGLAKGDPVESVSETIVEQQDNETNAGSV